MDEDRGKFGDRRTFNVDQEARDTLLANARRDAAEALLNTQDLLREVHAIKAAQTNFHNNIALAVVILGIGFWFKSGAPLPEWLNWLR